MIPADSAIKQLLAASIFTVTAVDIFCIVEFLQTPVVPALFLITYRF